MDKERFELTVQSSFEAAHRLPDYVGPCAHMHGHHWVVRATWATNITDVKTGMAIDFTVLKRLLMSSIRDLDHQLLNKIMSTTTVMQTIPTSENVARLIFARLTKQDFGEGLSSVEIEETPNCIVRYTRRAQ